MLRKKLRNKRGFTLIEIIVVIVILAVLMAVAVPSVLSYINEGNNAKYMTVARAVYQNTQVAYATAVAGGDGNNVEIDTANNVDEINLTASHVQTESNGTTIGESFGKYVEHKNYNGASDVDLKSVTLSGTGAAKDKDVATVKCNITIDNKMKSVTISANKKVVVSDGESDDN